MRNEAYKEHKDSLLNLFIAGVVGQSSANDQVEGKLPELKDLDFKVELEAVHCLQKGPLFNWSG